MSGASEFTRHAVALDRDGGPALWSQLEAELRRRLEAGHFDERFPTDHELMEIYGVSRHTARHAISKLDADGLVRRRRGVGSAVDRRRFEQSLGSLYSLFQVVEAAGIEQRSNVLALARTTDREACDQLGLEPAHPLVHLARVRLAGTEPLAVDRLWMPSPFADPLLEVDFTRTALYDELEHATGTRPTSGWERITPTVPGDTDRQLLGLEPGVAVFCLHRLATVDDRPVEWRTTLIRGDRFSFVADWSVGRHRGLRLAATGDDPAGPAASSVAS